MERPQAKRKERERGLILFPSSSSSSSHVGHESLRGKSREGGNENGLLARWYFFEWKKKDGFVTGRIPFFKKNCLFLFVEKRVRATHSFLGDSIIRLLFLGG